MSPRRPWERLGRARHQALEQRVANLEAEVSELRRHHLRLAELADVVQELLVPMASRDEERVRRAIDTFNASI